VDIGHQLQMPASVKVLDQMIPNSAQDGQVITLDGEWILQDGTEAEIIEHASTADKLHQQLIDFWKPRWWKDPLPKPEEWNRILNLPKHIYLLGNWLMWTYLLNHGWTLTKDMVLVQLVDLMGSATLICGRCHFNSKKNWSVF